MFKNLLAQRTEIATLENSNDCKPESKKSESKIRPIISQASCPHCNLKNNKNAVIYADVTNKEYFVYCDNCKIETVDTYSSKNKALKAFRDGQTITNKKEKR